MEYDMHMCVCKETYTDMEGKQGRRKGAKNRTSLPVRWEC